MDIKAFLSENNSRNAVDFCVNLISEDPGKLDELVELVFGMNEKISWRAAWVLSHVQERFPYLKKKYAELIIQKIVTVNNMSTVRSLLKILTLAEVSFENAGELFDTCFQWLEDPKQPNAVRVYSMILLYRFSEEFPEIKSELKYIIENILPNAPVSIQSRGKKIMAALSDEHKKVNNSNF